LIRGGSNRTVESAGSLFENVTETSMLRKLIYFGFMLLLAPIVLRFAMRKLNRPSFGEARSATHGDAPGGPRVVAALRSAAPGSPNIIFVLTDDLSPNLVQFMPKVLEMERKGVTFANYFVTDSLCCPSRSSIFTGEFPHDTGVFRNRPPDGGYDGFNAHGNESRTFAVALQQGGYKTALLGKYLNGYDPVKNGAAGGWNEWDVTDSGYGGFNYPLNEDGKVVYFGAKPRDYLTDVLSRLAVKFIREPKNAPFFIEIATFAPHGPYVAAPRDTQAFLGLRAPRSPAYDAAPDAQAAPWLIRLPPLSGPEMASIDRDFRKRAQSVLAVDKMIGDLQAAIAATGQQKKTYFIFSSDNGLHMGEHRLMPGKQTAFDTDIHVPLVITGPGVAAGRTLDEIVENTDLCPTFTELAGAASRPTAEGRSLVPLIHGQPVPEWRTLALIEHHRPRNKKYWHGLRDPDLPITMRAAVRAGNPPSYAAIRARDWVYVEYDNGAKEYHHHAGDPDELQNSFLSLSPAARASLHSKLAALHGCHGARACWQAALPSRVTLHAKTNLSNRVRSLPPIRLRS
jgi:N-acetylglucosamine-6-sulfatase